VDYLKFVWKASDVIFKSLLFEGCCQWWNNDAKRVGTLEFDRTRKSMGVIVKKTDSGKNLLLVKVFGIIHII
jgi:magnesium-transporting ATPase (P-type)